MEFFQYLGMDITIHSVAINKSNMFLHFLTLVNNCHLTTKAPQVNKSRSVLRHIQNVELYSKYENYQNDTSFFTAVKSIFSFRKDVFKLENLGKEIMINFYWF